MKTRCHNWDRDLIDGTKQSVRAELDALESKKGPAARLAGALAGVQWSVEPSSVDPSSVDPSTSDALLRRYVYAVSALVHHERHGGLKAAQVDGLAAIATGILQAGEIDPASRYLGFLYADVHSIVGQIMRKNGVHWGAAWQQLVAARCGGPTGGYQAVTLGNRHLRLGHAAQAIAQFRRAESERLSLQMRERCRLGLVTALRLAGHAGESRQCLAETQAWTAVSPRFRLELDWERVSLEAMIHGDFAPLLALTRRGATHHETSYLLEAALWSLACRRTTFLNRAPRAHALGRRRNLDTKRHKTLIGTVVALQACYDASMPLPIRIGDLGRALGRASRVANIDRELLIWAAATRWLSRAKAFDMAALCYGEYAATSRRLTDGRSPDALQVLGDIPDATWWQDRTQRPPDALTIEESA